MKISIITATYNSVKTLDACMDSVLNQTYSDIEYIIIDGNSTDGTLERIKSRAATHHNIIWTSEKDTGIYDALNKGIDKASGDVIGFVHSDDYLAETNIIGKIADIFMSQDVDGVYGNLHYVNFENPKVIVRNWRSKPFSEKLLKRGWMPAHPTLFLKREIYKSSGFFNLNYRIAADYDFILRIFSQRQLKFYFLPETITKMRIGGASNRSFKNLILKSKEDLRAARTNNLPYPMRVILLKNASKISQWISK